MNVVVDFYKLPLSKEERCSVKIGETVYSDTLEGWLDMVETVRKKIVAHQIQSTSMGVKGLEDITGVIHAAGMTGLSSFIDVGAIAQSLDRANKKIQELDIKLQENQRRTELFESCLSRALSAWQADHPEAQYWPDATENLTWLLEKMNMNVLGDLVVDRYQLDEWGSGVIDVALARAVQADGSTLWKISKVGCSLNKDGEWEFEPIPSSRTEAFFERTRFESVQAALEFWNSQKNDGGWQ